MIARRMLITGIRGFVGTHLAARARAEGWLVRGALRQDDDTDDVFVGDIGPSTEWGVALKGVDTIVHLAARVHVMNERSPDPLAAYSAVNVDGTARLARQAAEVGVRRFIYLSSIKVNGESTSEHPFSESDTPAPADPYGVSKMRAEEALWRVAEISGMEVVILRPPLVYGPGVKGNFLSMMVWLEKGVPLPFGTVRNKRSLVALDNLVDFIMTCIDHPGAANETFLISDGQDLSTPDLLRRMGEFLGRPARLFPAPVWLLHAGAALVGKRTIAQRLLGSLQVDIRKTRSMLNWEPPISVEEGLRRTAEYFLAQVGERQ